MIYFNIMNDKVRIIELGFVNAYLLKGDKGFVLIDTGLPQQQEQLENELKSAGCTPENLKLVILTHGDWDHTGNAAFLKEKYHTKIAVHPGDVNQAENGIFLKRKVKPLILKYSSQSGCLKGNSKKTRLLSRNLKPTFSYPTIRILTNTA